jgi:DNA invertase Pin-like site-specific DNA recombinase
MQAVMKRPRKIEQVAPKPAAPRVVGYARVSTSDQRLDLQIDALTKAGVHPDNIHRDYASGARAARRGLRNAMRDLREGDTLLVWKLDRLGRDLPDLIRNMQELDKIGVAFRSLTEALDTTTATGKLVLHIMAAIAQFERDITRERTAAGMRAAVARGVRLGAAPKLSDSQKKEVGKLLRKGNLTVRAIAKQFNVSPGTIYNMFPGGRSGLVQ